jgi:Glycosyltransferase family 87
MAATRLAARETRAPTAVRERGAGWWRRAYLLDLGLLALALVATAALTNVYWQDVAHDIGIYQQYALAFWTGRPRFVALPQEYPPAALLPFSLTLLFPASAVVAGFELAIGLLVLTGYLGFLRCSTRRHAILYACYLLLGAQGFLLGRYDLFPALLTLAALWLAQRRRFAAGYSALALATLLKLYPAVLLPLLVLEHWRHATARQVAKTLLAAFAIPVLLGVALPVLRNPAGGLSALAVAGQRPLQVESVPATLLWLAHLLGFPARSAFSYGADGLAGPLAGALAALSLPLLAAGCLLVYWRFARGRLALGRALLACVCVVVVTAKVFSTQYLIWVVPLAAEDGDYVPAWLLTCLLTFLDYPLLYPFNQPGYTPASVSVFALLMLARNGLLLWLTLRLLRSRGRLQ